MSNGADNPSKVRTELIIGFNNMKVIGDLANKCFIGVVGKIQIGVDFTCDRCNLLCLNYPPIKLI